MMGSSDLGRTSIPLASEDECSGGGGGGGGLPLLGMVFWVKGDDGLITFIDPDVGLLASDWIDQGTLGQDLTTAPGFEPLAGIDTIDGVPCVTFQQSSPTDEQYMWRAGFSMKNRDGNPFDFAQPRTVMAMVLPRFTPACFNITGGPVFCFGEIPSFQCIFDLEDNFGLNKLYAWSSGWRDPGPPGPAVRGPDTVGGAGGIYNGVPTLVEWYSSGNPDLGFAINGVDQALSGPQYGPTGATPNQGFFLGSPQAGVGLHWLGAYAEANVWDYDLRTDPAARAQARGYYRGRYPSAPVVP